MQFSVFEGEIRKSDLIKLKGMLKKLIYDEFDSVVIYTYEKPCYTTREVIGIDKNEPLFS